MQEENKTGQEPDNSVSGYYENYSETQKEVLAIELRKTRNTLFILAAIIFAGDILGLLMVNAIFLQAVLISLIVPAIMAGLAFLAGKEPMTAIVIAAVIIIGLWVYLMVISGGYSAVTGWIIKAIIIYFLIAGYQHAKEATRIKKELGI